MTMAETRKGPINLAAIYETDKDLELKGVWEELVLGEDAEGAEIKLRVKIARYNNHRFQDRMRALTKPLKFQIDNDNLRSAEADKLVDQVMADTILLDWEGEIQLPDGSIVSYSRENALRAFQLLPDFRDDVQARAKSRDLFRKQTIAAASGN